MPKLARLYLDTARLGLMSPSAQLAARDFARLAGEGVSTLYWQRFLQEGYSALGTHLQRRLPGLARWPGITELKAHFRRLFNAPDFAPVYLAGRATALARMACRVLCSRSRNVLVPDTLWPPYAAILREECSRRTCVVTTVKLRSPALQDQLTADAMVASALATYQRHGCDAIFLSSISSDGIRLPTHALLQQIRASGSPLLAVVDGAQEVGHCPVLLESNADFYLAGCHKWMGAGLPLGVCSLPRPETSDSLARQMELAGQASHLEDPLFSFLTCLSGGAINQGARETVNLISLPCAGAALAVLQQSRIPLDAAFSVRQQNADRLAQHASSIGWIARRPSPQLRSGILMLQSTRTGIRRRTANELQALFDRTRITITTYDDGLVRISLPGAPLQNRQLIEICQALALANGVPSQVPSADCPRLLAAR